MATNVIDSTALSEMAIRGLRPHFGGELIGPADPAYDAARRIWNGLVDRRPGLIARCTGVADVIAAVRFAREHDLRVAVRGGGHNVAGTALCDGGLVIDLSGLRGIHVDPAARTARVQPGVLWGAFDRETQQFGLATTGGIVTHTGVAGLTLGGGIGWLMRKHGATCDNLLSADIVTADGEFVRAGEQDHPDLLWGLRGGGGNFGIVTSFEFRLHAHGPTVLAGPVAYPAAQAGQVLRAYRDFIATAPDEVGTVVAVRRAPAAPWLPAGVHGQPVVMIIGCYAGPLEAGERVMAPLRALGDPLADALRPTAYTTLQGMFDASVPHGAHYYWKSHYLSPLGDAAIGALVAGAWDVRSPSSYTIMFHLGGALGRIAEDATAFSGRGAEHAVNFNAAWAPDLAEGSADIEWVRRQWAAVAPFSTGGVYMNFLDNEGQDRVRAAYGTDKYNRLAALKRRYDPGNFFRVNQNIEPLDGGRGMST